MKDLEFSKDDTLIVKACAIILMFMHHLWIFPNRLYGGDLKHWVMLESGESLVNLLGIVGKICVSLFFFVGGYGIYMSSKGKEFDLVGRLKKLYFEYWKVFFIVVPLGIMFFQNQESYCERVAQCEKYDNPTFNRIILSVTGISDTFDGNWWFFLSYVIAVMTFPLVRYLVHKHTFAVNMALITVWSVLMTDILPNLEKFSQFDSLKRNTLYIWFFTQTSPYITCFWAGVAFASANALVRLKKGLKDNGLLNPVFMIFVLIACFWLRRLKFGAYFDYLLSPVLCITFSYLFGALKPVAFVFKTMGKRSTYMWLNHGFFCYYTAFFARLVTLPRYALFALLVLLALSFAGSLVIEYFWKGVGALYNILKNATKKLRGIKL